MSISETQIFWYIGLSFLDLLNSLANFNIHFVNFTEFQTMKIFICLTATLAVGVSLSVHPRQEKIPEPAPISAYLKAGPDTKGRVKPYVPIMWMSL
jgi:hypothetical protein